MIDTLEPLQRYFDGEKQGALWCLAIGVAALAMATWLWRTSGSFRAMAVPLALIALVQVGVGASLLARTDRQVATLRAELSAQRGPARDKELARMERVNRSFRVIEIAEVVLIVVGLVLVFAVRSRPAVMAVGMGLLLQASVMLVFDLFAEHRAHAYTAWLRDLA